MILHDKYNLVQFYIQKSNHLHFHYFHHHIRGYISFHLRSAQCTVLSCNRRKSQDYIEDIHNYFRMLNILEGTKDIFFVDYHKRFQHYKSLENHFQHDFLSIHFRISYTQACIYSSQTSIQNFQYERIYYIYLSQLHHYIDIAFQQLQTLRGINIELHPKENLESEGNDFHQFFSIYFQSKKTQ